MSRADSPRWTSAKFVVQYPKDSTKPSPNTMPIQLALSGLCEPPVCAHVVRAGTDRPPYQQSDAEHGDEVQAQDHVIDRAQMKAQATFG